MTQNVKDIYPLSPMQQGMLFHSIYTSESAMYAEQLACRLSGNLDTGAFRSAWQEVLDRHDILRTSFVWEDLDEPLQVVHQQAELPFEFLDWQKEPQDKHSALLDNLLEAERTRGIDVLEAPLMRNILVQLDNREYFFIWNHHHLLFDVWGLPLILQQVFQIYDARTHGSDLQLAPVRPYKDTIYWLQQQDMNKAETV